MLHLKKTQLLADRKPINQDKKSLSPKLGFVNKNIKSQMVKVK